MTLPKVVRTFEDFIKVDVATGDIDPVYYAVARAVDKKGYDWAARFCVSMLAYYHTGQAAQCADREGKDFWEYMESIYPIALRGTMRRHFRGENGRKGLAAMRQFSPRPEDFFQRFSPEYRNVVKLCEKELYSFGPYFQLKVIDFMDSCLNHTVSGMEGLARNLSKKPAQSAVELYPGKSVPEAFLRICEDVKPLNIRSGPWFERYIGPAEVESSLCGWASTKYGGAWFGSDILEKRNALLDHGPSAEDMANWMPLVPLKTLFILDLK